MHGNNELDNEQARDLLDGAEWVDVAAIGQLPFFVPAAEHTMPRALRHRSHSHPLSFGMSTFSGHIFAQPPAACMTQFLRS